MTRPNAAVALGVDEEDIDELADEIGVDGDDIDEEALLAMADLLDNDDD